MRQYLDLMRHILEHGNRKQDRTGTGTLSVFGPQLRFDLQAGFPLLSLAKTESELEDVFLKLASGTSAAEKGAE